MKKYGFFILALAAFFAVSCSSTPEETQAPEPEQPVDSMAAPVVPSAPAVPAPEGEFRKAEDLKKAIDGYGLSFALPDEYQKANGEFEAGKAAMGSDNAGAKSLLDSAGARYQAVFDAAIDQGSKKRLGEISAAKSQADTIKAARAAADDYKLGEDKTAEGRQLLGQKQYLEAWAASEAALGAYKRSYATAKVKRDNADGALKKADAAQETANTRLEEVDKEIGGGAE
jgi:hypothetical protein